jgi:hypothetical protein
MHLAQKEVIFMSTLPLRQKIAAMEPGTIFTTQSLLGESSATRGAIDTMLHRAHRRGLIQRLARGVYRKFIAAPDPPVEVVAEIKATAFKRRLCGCAQKDCMHAMVTTRNDPMNNAERGKKGKTKKKQKQTQIVFAINGASSAFMYKDLKVILRSTSGKRVLWCQTEFGQMINRLVQVGREDCTPELLASSMASLRSEPTPSEIRRFAKLMPGWLFAKLKVRLSNKIAA